MSLITKTMKYRIEYNKDLYKWLKDIQYNVFRMKNKAITMAWDWQQFSFGYKKRFEKYPNQKEVIGRTLKQDIYHEVKEWNVGYNSLFCDASIKEALDKFKEKKEAILKGEESIISYKRNGSFPIRAQQICNLQKEKEHIYKVDFSLLSSKKAKEEKTKTQVNVTLRAGGGASDIMDRVINNEYKMADSRIIYNQRKKRFFLLLTYKFEPPKVTTNPYRIMGVDLGLVIPATVTINDIPYSTKYVGNAQEVEEFVNQIEERKRRIQRARKWAGRGSVGHGVKTRIKPLNKIRNKISNFKDTKNHQWSRYIVDYAVKNGVGTIQMEDLSGIREKDKFLKDWTYYDFQYKIEYKAKEYGINVIKVKPQFTSSRCYRCGAIHRPKDDQKWRSKRDLFTCLNCNYEAHADRNASENLSIPSIDKVIEQEKDMWFKKWEKQLNSLVR